jgi:hypothetical protein
LREIELAKVGDIGDFLNDNLEALHGLKAKQREAEENAFRATFRFIYETMEDNAFRRFDAAKNRFLGGFSIASFEVVALGIGFNAKPGGALPRINGLTKKVQLLWSNASFTKYSGSGVRASSRIPKIVPMGRKLFSK